jgi:hypothetical protein
MKRVFFFSVASLGLLALVFFLLTRRQDEPVKKPQLLVDRKMDEIEEIRISNQFDSYSVYQEEGGFAIADLPMDLVYAEYLLMLLDEASRVEYIEIVSLFERPVISLNLAPYGLDRPLGAAFIRYSSGESLSLIFGAVERISGGQYFMVEGGDTVYLMDHSRVVRFLQPLKRFINFEIVPVRTVSSPLSTIKSLTLSGRAFPRPVFISEIRTDNEEEMRDALAFGAVTHLIRSPYQRKIDQKETIDVFGSLSGLLNIEVLDYNCGDTVLAEYGLNDPLVKAEFVFKRGNDFKPENIVLKVALYQGSYILMRDDQRVVHRMERKPFFMTSYEKLVSRWFLTPFITDVKSIVIRSGGRDYSFELSGEDNRSLEAELEGAKLDMSLFRKFYTLLVSASSDSLLLEDPEPTGQPVLSVVFYYRDPLKKPDAMIFSPGSLRRLYVSVNGVTEFACLERYAQTLETALSALVRGEDFRSEW